MYSLSRRWRNSHSDQTYCTLITQLMHFPAQMLHPGRTQHGGATLHRATYCCSSMLQYVITWLVTMRLPAFVCYAGGYFKGTTFVFFRYTPHRAIAQAGVYWSYRITRPRPLVIYVWENKQVKVKLYLHRPIGVQEVESPRISRNSAHEGGKAVSPTHRLPLPLGEIPDTHFCYRLNRPQG
jgi:hypothetical protein